MAQKADDNHTPGGQPVDPNVAPCSPPKRFELRQFVRPVAALPLHRVMTLNEAFAQAKSRLGGDDLAARDLWRHARGRRLMIAARWIARDGTEGALIFRSAFWKYFEILPPGLSRPEAVYVEVQEVGVRAQRNAFLTGERPSLSGQWYFFVGRKCFDRLYSTAAPSKPAGQTPIGQEAGKWDADQNLAGRARRGRKPYEWELYKAKFYLMLDDDDVSAHADINVSRYADRLMTWGQNNFGEENTPKVTQMRDNVAEWKSLWPVLKNANK
jgi:hypothetical protein